MSTNNFITKEKLDDIIFKLINYIKKEDYKGYDPYDVLNSPLFKLPILSSNKLIRFTAQQVFRRIPINLRPLIGIKKEFNPVTGGLCIQAYTYLSKCYPEKKDFFQNEIIYLLEKLEESKSKGYSGYCWGYNFDWEARYTKIPKYCPTVVATGIITNGLYEYWSYTKDERVKKILISSANFVLDDLNRSYEGETFCFSYSPNDRQKVYNATMKGARLLSQVYELTKDIKYILEAKKTVDFVVRNQNEDGSWYYSKGDARKWVDNFHTAYVLDSLKSFIELSGYNEYEEYLKRGLKYYLENLFDENGYPKYYSDRFYPIDATNTAQSIITLINFNELTKSSQVLFFALDNLYNEYGYFYYRRKFLMHKTPYIRWSLSWILLSLSGFRSKSYD
ncbi:MAG: hypothetical protein NZM09_10800 [Ignavibacterium sp.]|nr:hypothetical protein [Ignavibacterium sp.]MDW8376166.1 hypothetical protein [Ignavibacteriales bacterium]